MSTWFMNASQDQTESKNTNLVAQVVISVVVVILLAIGFAIGFKYYRIYRDENYKIFENQNSQSSFDNPAFESSFQMHENPSTIPGRN